MSNKHDNYEGIIIPTYVFDIKCDDIRLCHIKSQFESRNEFDVKLIDVSKFNSKALWKNVVSVVKDALKNDDDVIIICQGDHCFTGFYSKEYLIMNIIEASDQGALLLSGGISGFNHVVPLTVNRFWIDKFLSIQFIVLYKNIYGKILQYAFKNGDTPTQVLSEITSQKMVLYPFISEQKEFMDKDIVFNEKEINETIADLFSKSASRLEKIKSAYIKYNTIKI